MCYQEFERFANPRKTSLVVILRLFAWLAHDGESLAKEPAVCSVFFFPFLTLAIVLAKTLSWKCKRKSISGRNESPAFEAPLLSTSLRLAFFLNYY